MERAKQVVEPAGAATIAALMQYPGRFAGPVVAVLSGGNVDPLLLLQIIQHGMRAAGHDGIDNIAAGAPDVGGHAAYVRSPRPRALLAPLAER